MSSLNRATLIKIHMLLAAFIFPVALMFVITGGLYTWEFKGSYETVTHAISLAERMEKDQQKLLALARRELERLKVPLPSGKAGVKSAGTSYYLEWTGSNRDVILQPTSDPLTAELQVKDTSWYRHFVQLHKAKGGQAFKVYAAILAISLLTILTTGFLMAWQMPKYRKLAATFSAAGIITFMAMVLSD